MPTLWQKIRQNPARWHLSPYRGDITKTIEAVLFNPDYGVQTAKRIWFSVIVIGVLLPGAIDDHPVTMSAF
jgi:hypothetical protein